MPSKLEEKLSLLPDAPGVYMFKDGNGNIIYIGKAVSLKKRVKSYFQERSRWIKEIYLLKEIEDLDYIVTTNEVEALILEGNLIKRYRPKYNVLLKDDKSYPFIKIEINNPYPAIRVIRRPVQDGSIYFGPFVSSYALKELLDELKKTFGIRSCSDHVFKNRSRPCMLYQINRCLAPCCGKIGKDEYGEKVNELVAVLSGRGKKILDDLRKKMREAAECLQFEKAASIRDRIASIEKILSAQVAYKPLGHDVDALFFQRKDNQYFLCLINVDEGKMVGKREFVLDYSGGDDMFLYEFLEKYYTTNPIPDMIVLPKEPFGIKLLKDIFSRRRGKKVRIVVPKRGEKMLLLKIAEENLLESIKKGIFGEKGELLGALRRSLGLHTIPERIEAIDISHIGGRYVVGGVVSALKGEIDKSGYRVYHLDGGFDDIKSLRELISRRYSKHEPPDLLIIDGGKNQLKAAYEEMKKLGIENMPSIGAIAKGRARGVFDRIYMGEEGKIIKLNPSRKEFRFLLKLRDEAHRFSNRMRSIWKRRDDFTPTLEEIRGIGPKRSKMILERFGSPEEFFKKVMEGEDVGLPKNVLEEVRKYLEEKGYSH